MKHERKISGAIDNVRKSSIKKRDSKQYMKAANKQ